MSQFSAERKLFSFVGLTPSEYSSGEHVRQGHITKQGRPLLRRVLVQAAWVAIHKDSHLLSVYERISQKSGKKKAIVAVARRLIGHIRACIKANELYKIQTISSQKAKEIEAFEVDEETGELLEVLE
jgi:transposase